MAEQNNILHKGWLTTRDGEKYAPATLIENVFSRDNTPYDTVIKRHIDTEIGKSTTSLATLQNKVNDVETKLSSDIANLQDKDTQIEDKLTHFGDDLSDKLFIIDANSNVIAYVDEQGVTSTDFVAKDASGNIVAKLTDAAQGVSGLQTRVSSIENALRNIDIDNDDDTFYIIDSEENVIAYIDKDGVHSTNFIIDNISSEYKDYCSLLGKVEEHITELKDLNDAIETLKTVDTNLQTNLQSFTEEVNERLKYFDGTSDDAFYFIDNNGNAVAYIDECGIHTTGLAVNNQGITAPMALNIYNSNGILLAQIDDSGVYSTNFYVKNIEGSIVENLSLALQSLRQTDSDLSTALETTNQTLASEIERSVQRDNTLQDNIDAVNSRTEFINGQEDRALYIIDKDNNVLAYVAEDGIHSTNLSIDNANGTVYNVKNQLSTLIDENSAQQTQLAGLRSDLTTEQQDRMDADQVLQENIDDVNARTAHIDGTEDERFYIVDKNNNVVAYIDGGGVHSIEFTTEPHVAGTRKTRYQMTELGDSVEALEAWRPSAQNTLNAHGSDIETLFQIAGTNTYNGVSHKTRIDKIDDILDLDSAKVDGKSTRLDRLDALVGASDDAASLSTGASHEAKIKGLINNLESLSNTTDQNHKDQQASINALLTKTQYFDIPFEDAYYIIDNNDNVIAYFNSQGLTVTQLSVAGLVEVNGRYESQYTGDSNSRYSVTQKIADLLNAISNHTTRLQSIEQRLNTQEAVTGETTVPEKSHHNRLLSIENELLLNQDTTRLSADEARIQTLEGVVGSRSDVANDAASGTHEARIKSNNSKITAIENALGKNAIGQFEIYNAMKDLVGTSGDTASASGTHENRIKYLQDKIKTVSNVMDFIGPFDTYTLLQAYSTPHLGDVAIVKENATEYVYDGAAWVELGNSTSTATAISNLQGVVGATSLTGSEKSHQQRLSELEEDVNVLNSTTGANINYLHSTINYRGNFSSEVAISDPKLGDLAHIGSGTEKKLYIYNHIWDGTQDTYAWQVFSGISRNQYNIDGSDDNTLYIVDKHNNVIATFGANGLTTTDLHLKKSDNQFTSKSSMTFMEVTEVEKYTI